MKTLAIWLGSALLLLLTLAGIGGLAYYKYGQLQAAMNIGAPPEQPTTVVAEEAGELSFRNSTTMIGTVLAPRSIMLSNEIAGTVSAIHFEPGQVVEEGQLLVELDISVEQAQLEAAKARREIAESAYKRIREAANSRAVTPSELDEAVAQLSQATAEVDELQAVINRKTLRAPFHGKLGLADTHRGQFLPSGFAIASLQGIEDFVFVDFMIPQSIADLVHVDDSVKLIVGSRTLTGKVLARDSQSNRGSRNLLARAKTASHPEFLLPGDSVKVFIEYGEEMQVATVGPEALCSAPMETFVYVLERDQENMLRAYQRMVDPGPTIGDRLCILSGVEVGELVADAGSFKLRSGALVTTAEDKQVVANSSPERDVSAVR